MAAAAGTMHGAGSDRPINSRARRDAMVERWWPLAFAIVAGSLAWCVVHPGGGFYKGLKEVLASSVDTVAIFAGFQGTWLTLLSSFRSNQVVKAITDAQLYPRLVDYHLHALIATLVVLGACLGLQFAQGASPSFGSYENEIAGGLAFLVALAVAMTWRSLRIMATILRADG